MVQLPLETGKQQGETVWPWPQDGPRSLPPSRDPGEQESRSRGAPDPDNKNSDENAGFKQNKASLCLERGEVREECRDGEAGWKTTHEHQPWGLGSGSGPGKQVSMARGPFYVSPGAGRDFLLSHASQPATHPAREFPQVTSLSARAKPLLLHTRASVWGPQGLGSQGPSAGPAVGAARSGAHVDLSRWRGLARLSPVPPAAR